MSRRTDETNRVLGPTWCPSMSYYRLVVITPGAADPKQRRLTRYYRDEDEAEEAAVAARRLIERNEQRKLEDAIEEYRAALEEKGTKEVSYRETKRRLLAFFPNLAMPVSRVTPERAKAYYKAFRTRACGNKRGTVSVAYHRSALINARSFFSWCIEQNYVELNPFAGVKGIGHRNAGKFQLTGDEITRWYGVCFKHAEQGDHDALALLMMYCMSLRSGDVIRRVVRDVDLDCTALRIERGKTAKSNRPRAIPHQLQPLIRRVVDGRQPLEPLFPTHLTDSGFHTNRWLHQALEKYCARARVPRICPHALKGMGLTVLTELGFAPQAVADHGSHENIATTMKHYVAPGALEEAQAKMALKVLSGGKR